MILYALIFSAEQCFILELPEPFKYEYITERILFVILLNVHM